VLYSNTERAATVSSNVRSTQKKQTISHRRHLDAVLPVWGTVPGAGPWADWRMKSNPPPHENKRVNTTKIVSESQVQWEQDMSSSSDEETSQRRTPREKPRKERSSSDEENQELRWAPEWSQIRFVLYSNTERVATVSSNVKSTWKKQISRLKDEV